MSVTEWKHNITSMCMGDNDIMPKFHLAPQKPARKVFAAALDQKASALAFFDGHTTIAMLVARIIPADEAGAQGRAWGLFFKRLPLLDYDCTIKKQILVLLAPL